MRAVKNDGEGWVKLKPESIEDLWYISRIVEKGDEVEGHSMRRYRPPGAKEDSGERKSVNLRVKVSNVEFAESANKLRITGKILSGTPEEFVQVGEHHTIDVEPHEQIKLFAKMAFDKQAVLKEALRRSKHVKGIVVVIDEHKALAIAVETRGARQLFELENNASKRSPEEFEAKQAKFFGEVAEALAQRQSDAIVVAGPGFAKDNFKKFLKEKMPELLKKTVFEYASSAEKSALTELLKKGVVQTALGALKLAEEGELLEKFKESLGKNDGMAAYGEKQVAGAVAENSCETVLVSDALLREKESVRKLMEKAERIGAKIVVFDGSGDAGREFEPFGIACFLRYRKSW